MFFAVCNHFDRYSQLFLEQGKKEELGALFKLVKDYPGAREETNRVFGDYFLARALATLHALQQQASREKPVEPAAYVNALLDVHRYFADFLLVSFSRDPAFAKKFDVTCLSFVNKNSVVAAGGSERGLSAHKSPELLARYVDGILKKSAKHLQDDELEKALCDVVSVILFSPLSTD
jgi:cullin 1